MGTHRWLLGPLICLILATTSARPPECEPPPSWSIDGQQPLAQTKGKASMLEAMLSHLRSYGMDDLEFIIVNSKLSHSQEKLYELKRRVSFEVHQETDEEPVWSVMEGGKDDMYVYDRCGRLTYYIPFPLSILNESPLVSNAILATYFRSPCGDNCAQNKSLEIDEFVKNMERDLQAENVTEEDESAYTETEQPIYSNETSNGTESSNDLFNVTASEDNEMDILNYNNTANVTDYDYPTYDNNLQLNATNVTSIEKEKSIFNSIYRLFFNAGNNDDNKHPNETSSGENSPPPITDNDNNGMTNGHAHHRNNGHHTHVSERLEDKPKSDRCLEADFQVCKNWSKRRLLHVQRCCSEVHLDPESHDHRSCDNFGKKRCKKMQSILKCCIKTVYTEPAAEALTEVSATMTATAESSTVSLREESTTLTPESVAAPDMVCCKTVNDDKLCRVSYSGTCDEDEHIEDRQTAERM